jgi:hypothetical protein
MSYSGNVTVGGPADTRELPGLSITKVAVGPMDNNAYLLRCTQTGELALIDAARAGGLGGPLDGPGAEGDAGQARDQGGGAGEGDFRADHAGWPAYFKHGVCKHTLGALNFAWHWVIRWWMHLHLGSWKDARRHLTGPHGQWIRPSADRRWPAVGAKRRGPGRTPAGRSP